MSNPKVTVAHPLPKFTKMAVRDMPPGTVFVNTYHSPEKIMSGNEQFSVYMKVIPRNDGVSARMQADWDTPLAVNLRNGNAYNLKTKRNAPLEGYIMDAEIIVRLLG